MFSPQSTHLDRQTDGQAVESCPAQFLYYVLSAFYQLYYRYSF